MNPDIKDFYAFTPDSFRVEDYTPAPFSAKIPIAV
jgi:thymidylate synthase